MEEHEKEEEGRNKGGNSDVPGEAEYEQRRRRIADSKVILQSLV